MPLFHLLLVAAIQGLTEFLPVSSSAHLILLPSLTGLADQGQAIDVSVHLGTLGAVLVYFRADTRLVLSGLPRLLRGDTAHPGARLFLLLFLATVPVMLFGLILKFSGLDDMLRSVAVIGWTMILFGLLLWWTDQRGGTTLDGSDWSARHALVMGLWQMLALVPGTSRSGITISAARWLGYARTDATRLAMLMSIPAIIASGAVLMTEVALDTDLALARDMAIAAVLTFAMALGALWGMIRLLRVVSFTPYVIYRVVLGIFLLWVAYR